MPDLILYGDRAPEVEGYFTSSSGRTEFRLSVDESVEIREEIFWVHLLKGENRRAAGRHLSEGSPYNGYMGRLWDRLRNYCHESSEIERAFFDMYCGLCWHSDGPVELTPALIPNVTLNWYTEQTVRQNSGEPFYVDFVMKTPSIGGDSLAVIEIDGPSHYARYSEGKYHLSEREYAKHLRRDKFLRDSGFAVFRIANIEVEKISHIEDPNERLQAFYNFFEDTVGKAIWSEKLGLPDDFHPHR